ncbi:Myosin type-2 heavy chain 1, partial [Cladochytrium tenue]
MARRELVALKTESRSVGKLKEVNYTLETKVVELSQALQKRADDGRHLVEKTTALESQIHSWKERFARVEERSRELEKEHAEVSATLNREVATLKEANATITKERDRLNQALKRKEEELHGQSEEIKKLQEKVKAAAHAPSPTMPPARLEDESTTVMALRAEVATLKKMLTAQQSSPTGSPKSNAARALPPTPIVARPAAASNPRANITRSQSIALDDLSRFRPKPKRSNSIFDSDIYTDAEPWVAIESRRPTERRGYSVASEGAAIGCQWNLGLWIESSVVGPEDQRRVEANEAQVAALTDPRLLEQVRSELIAGLHIPEPLGDGTELPMEDVLFPAHLVALLVLSFLRHDMLLQLQHLMNFVMEDIFDAIVQAEDHYRPLFWLSNIHELISLVTSLYYHEANLPNNKSHMNVLRTLRGDLFSLQSQAMTAFMEDLKRDVATLSVPAILDSQELPGLAEPTTGASSTFWGLAGGGSGGSGLIGAGDSSDDIAALKAFLSELDRTVGAYGLPGEVRAQVLGESVRVAGVASFNALLLRRGFSTFKRGCQIQYNVTQLEEWCMLHHLPEAVTHVQPVLQAAKLLTLNKRDTKDVDVMLEHADVLSRAQILALMEGYSRRDPDSK